MQAKSQLKFLCAAPLPYYPPIVSTPSYLSHQFYPLITMSSEIIDLTIKSLLPKNIKQNWIPLDGLPIPHLFQFTQYLPPETVYHDPPVPSHLIHEEELVDFNLQSLLQFSPPQKQLISKYQTAIKTAPSPIHSFTLISLPGNHFKFPIWAFDYWPEIGRAVGYHSDWKKALVWLRGFSELESTREKCEQIMAGLSHFSWNGGKCNVHDMVSILSNSWLSDVHIDHALKKISGCYKHHYGDEVSKSYVFISVMDLTSISNAYMSGKPSGDTSMKINALREIENKIIKGNVHSIAGVLHLPGHWTSLIIEFGSPRIIFGDSLGNKMPPPQARSFKQWISHMLHRSERNILTSDIPILPLETSIQRDSNSCGLFAVNAIGHHYLPWDFPLLGSDILSLVQYRMEIALELLEADDVSVLLLNRLFMQWLIICDRL